MIASQNIWLLAALAALAGSLIILIAVRTARKRAAHGFEASKAAGATDVVRTSQAAEQVGLQSSKAAIVENLNSIDMLTTQQLSRLLISMAEASDWQVLGKHFDVLSKQRLVHLRALVARPQNSVSPEQALHHTMEAYCISCLIIALYDELVAQSEVVSEVLDEWFRANGGMSVSEFRASVDVDCARILLIDLDYSRPSRETSLAQLRLAEKHCQNVGIAPEEDSSPVHAVLSEIELRKKRLAY
jgi:hypothetical protein